MRTLLAACELPYPPSANRYWRNFRGRMVRSAEARAYIASVHKLLGHLRPTKDDVAVELEVIRPARRGDLDNRVKIVLDALAGPLYENDAQVVEIHAWRLDYLKARRAGPFKGMVLVRAYSVSGSAPIRPEMTQDVEVDPSDWERPRGKLR